MNKRTVISLTGTPGTGKSSAARILRKKGFVVINLNSKIKKHRLYSGYDKKRKTYIAGFGKIEKFLKKELKKYKNKKVIIDSHLSHLLPESIVNAVIVLRCNPNDLEKRLEKKGWDKGKIRENIEAEIIGLIEYEARKRHRKVFVIDSTKLTAEQVAKKIGRLLT